MKKLLLLLLCLPIIGFGQIVQPCLSNVDTVECGDSSLYNYTYQRTRGFWFHPQSTFNIVGVKAADGNPDGLAATHQSIEIIKFDTLPLTGSTSFNPHTTLFSAINVPHSWLTCNVQIDSGSYYGIIGAKNDSVPWLMYNSYTGGTLKLLMNGDSTVIHRAGVQYSLGTGSPQNGLYFDDGLSYIGRIHFITSIDNTPQIQIIQIGQTIEALGFGGISPYTFLWNTVESTSFITPQSNGNYWALITDANGCISDTAYFNVTFVSTDLDNLLNYKTKRLNSIINVLGTTTKPKPNIILFYIYNDGTVEKRMIIE